MSSYDANVAAADPNASHPTSHPPGAWALTEDRPGKPGWISGGSYDGKQAATEPELRFPMRFGRQPLLTIAWLRSYQGVGDALLNIGPATGC